MNLKDYLSNKAKASKGKTKDWLYFCTLDIKTGSLWAGDPHLAHAEDGCVVKLPLGRYVLEGIGLKFGRHRVVARLRVRLESAKQPILGKKVGDTGTDSAMVGVCDIKVFDKACGADLGEEVQEAIEAQTGKGFGIIAFKKFPGAVMPFIPTGSDGTGPVYALMSGRKRIGVELPFMDQDEELDAKREDIASVSLLEEDKDDFMTRLVDGKEVSFWLGGQLKAGVKFYLWSTAPQGPVDYRIRRASGATVKTWSPMKKYEKNFRAFETLKAGQYEIDFRIGREVFSSLKLSLI